MDPFQALTTMRQRFEQERSKADSIRQSIPVTAVPAAATTIYTVPPYADFHLRHFYAVNTTGGALTLTVHFVPDGGSVQTANMVIPAQSIPANQVVALDFLRGDPGGAILPSGTTIRAFCSSANGINVGGWGDEIRGTAS